MNAGWWTNGVPTPELCVTIVGSLAVVHTHDNAIAAVAVVTAEGMPRAVSRAREKYRKRK